MSILWYLVGLYLIVMVFLYLKYPEKMREAFTPPREHIKNNKDKTTKNNTKLKYRALDNLFTPTEQKFLSVLESIAGDELKVFGKVRISDIITPAVNKFEKGSGWHWLFSQISQKHVDFVITDANLNLICAVELNDPSHEREDRKKRDQFVTEAFESANVPLVMIDTQHKYLDQHIADTIAQKVTGL